MQMRHTKLVLFSVVYRYFAVHSRHRSLFSFSVDIQVEIPVDFFKVMAPFAAPAVKNKGILYTSIFQIILGSVAITFGSFSLERFCELGYIAQGIWTGSVIVLAGIFGIIAYCKESKGWIETYMWTSAVSILVAAALVTLETVAYTFTYIDCTVPIRECDETCLNYHRYLMATGEFLQAACIGAVVVGGRTLRKDKCDIGVPYKRLTTDV
ncbi:uncharacterized protein [Apostichopus japonicus]|uniref:uncharacterized protein isoform X2 n=1 Tax=Stichopus japonicus TaxID=307972 RepID=UPI003AB60AA6